MLKIASQQAPEITVALATKRSDFRDFIHRGNAVDLAIGVVIGAAFSKIVNSIVDDLLFPVLSLFIGQQLEHAFLILRYVTKDITPPVGSFSFPGEHGLS